MEHDEHLILTDNYGDVCAIEVILNGIRTLIFAVYISPETTIKQKKYFMTRNVYSYARQNISFLVSGDFNIDISKQENVEFVTFMEESMKLRLLSTSSQATTLEGTCIDLVFGQNIDVESRRYVSHFSYHRPLLSMIKSSE